MNFIRSSEPGRASLRSSSYDFCFLAPLFSGHSIGLTVRFLDFLIDPSGGVAMPASFYNTDSQTDGATPAQYSPSLFDANDQGDNDMQFSDSDNASDDNQNGEEEEEADYDMTGDGHDAEQDQQDEEAESEPAEAFAGSMSKGRISRKLGLGDYVDADLYGLRRSVCRLFFSFDCVVVPWRPDFTTVAEPSQHCQSRLQSLTIHAH